MSSTGIETGQGTTFVRRQIPRSPPVMRGLRLQLMISFHAGMNSNGSRYMARAGKGSPPVIVLITLSASFAPCSGSAAFTSRTPEASRAISAEWSDPDRSRFRKVSIAALAT